MLSSNIEKCNSRWVFFFFFVSEIFLLVLPCAGSCTWICTFYSLDHDPFVIPHLQSAVICVRAVTAAQ